MRQDLDKLVSELKRLGIRYNAARSLEWQDCGKIVKTNRKEEHNKIMWHAAFGGPRITLGWVVYDENIWEDIIEELTSEERAQGKEASYLNATDPANQ